MHKPVKPKKCEICNTPFTPFLTTQKVCGVSCAAEYARNARERIEAHEKKADRKDTRERKLKLKSRSEWLKDAQVVFNKFIRMRDEKLGCCSCEKSSWWDGQWHASHYRSVGSSPELRFVELNVHKACSVCNNHLSGNLINYRIKLIDKIGLQAVEWLEGKHEPKKYTIDDIKSIISLYKAKIKALSI